MSRTLAGRDFQSRVMGDGGAAGVGTGAMAPADFIGLSANSDAFDADNVTLPGEISGSTLDRAQAAYAHTNGQATYTLTRTFTSDQTVTLRKAGVFNASSGGTLVFEELFGTAASLTSGDQISVTVTVTL